MRPSHKNDASCKVFSPGAKYSWVNLLLCAWLLGLCRGHPSKNPIDVTRTVTKSNLSHKVRLLNVSAFSKPLGN